MLDSVKLTVMMMKMMVMVTRKVEEEAGHLEMVEMDLMVKAQVEGGVEMIETQLIMKSEVEE